MRQNTTVILTSARHTLRLTLALAAAALASAAAAETTTAAGQNSAATSTSGSVAIVNNGGQGHGRSQRIATTASAIAPGLTAAGVHSCAGSASLGVGGTGFNFGVGSTYEMIECNRRAYAATLVGIGQNAAALAMICNNPEVQAALNVTGVICPQQLAAASAQAGPITGGVVTAYASASAPAAIGSTQPNRRNPCHGSSSTDMIECGRTMKQTASAGAPLVITPTGARRR
ncbi:MAG TPA: hypothetical protein VGU45_17810 [Microvirga sp.]|jgi:hypothetical protein|nr:hypothetical protein [Microvirga sp.]